MRKILLFVFILSAICSGQIITGASLSIRLKNYVTQSQFTSTINGLIIGGGGLTLEQVRAIVHDTALTCSRSGHNHSGIYELANSNIQAHVTSAHAPSNAQKNSDITKAEIEAKLTGEITTHTHAGGGGEANDGANVGISGIGWYKSKTGVTLNFRNAVAASTKLTINLNDVNNIVEFDVAPANIDHNSLLNYSANRHIDHTAVSISGGTSLTGGGAIDANRTITLQNDAASPGNSYYYGTNAGGTKGYYALPSGGGGDFNSNFFRSPIFATANLTGTLSCTTNKTFFLYMGRTSRNFSQIAVEFRVTTLAATITWAEVGIFKGAIPARGGNASLSRLGFANVATIVNTTGQKNVTITLTNNAAAGDDIWLAWGNQSTTVMVLRAQSIADDLQSGCYQGMTSTRISTCAIPVTTTIESATALPAWILGRSL